jgi:predicted ArsR family transcriptional regulator
LEYTTSLHSASNRYPNHPGSRNGSPETSEEAAAAIAPLARGHRAKILRHLQEIHPTACSSDQIADALELSPHAVRSRVSELYAGQKIERTNDRSTNENGRTVVLWKAVA